MFKKLSKKFGSKDKPVSPSAGTTTITATPPLATTQLGQSATATVQIPPSLTGAPLLPPLAANTASKSSGQSLAPLPTSSPPPPSAGSDLSDDVKSLTKKRSSSSVKLVSTASSAATSSDARASTSFSEVHVQQLTNGIADGSDDFAELALKSATEITRADLLRPIPSLIDASGSPSPSTAPPPAQLLLVKLRLCCVQFEWSADEGAATPITNGTINGAATAAPSPLATKDTRAKDAKRAQLLEILDYIGKAKNIYNEAVLTEFLHMIATNLFRALPPKATELPTDEDEPVFEPSWQHLQVVYELFLRFIVANDVDIRALKKHINGPFVLRLLELFDSEDHRERDYLKTILHRIYAKFMSLRAFIRKAINHVFFQFIYESERHNGIAELLEILGSIINGFALPLKNEHKVFLRRVLIPMHKVSCLAQFHQQLAYCVSQFVDKDSELAHAVIGGLLKYWPLANSAKEVLFLNELEQILELTQPEEFATLAPSLATRLSLSIGSQHFQVAERALFLWHNEYVSHLIAQHRTIILPTLLPVLEAAEHSGPSDETTDATSADGGPSGGGGHWNPTVNSLTLNVLKIFADLDPALVAECREKLKREYDEKKSKQADRAEAWRKLQLRQPESPTNESGSASTSSSSGSGSGPGGARDIEAGAD